MMNDRLTISESYEIIILSRAIKASREVSFHHSYQNYGPRML